MTVFLLETNFLMHWINIFDKRFRKLDQLGIVLLLTSRKRFKADAYANLGTHHASIHFILPYQEAGQ